MEDSIETFVKMVRQRSIQNFSAFNCMEHLPQIQTALLRIELDSMIRVLHVLSYKPCDRSDMIERFYSAGRFENATGKRITDAQMVAAATELEGWTKVCL